VSDRRLYHADWLIGRHRQSLCGIDSTMWEFLISSNQYSETLDRYASAEQDIRNNNGKIYLSKGQQNLTEKVYFYEEKSSHPPW